MKTIEIEIDEQFLEEIDLAEIKAYLQKATQNFYLQKLAAQVENDLKENQISHHQLGGVRRKVWEKHKVNFLKGCFSNI